MKQETKKHSPLDEDASNLKTCNSCGYLFLTYQPLQTSCNNCQQDERFLRKMRYIRSYRYAKN